VGVGGDHSPEDTMPATAKSHTAPNEMDKQTNFYRTGKHTHTHALTCTYTLGHASHNVRNINTLTAGK